MVTRAKVGIHKPHIFQAFIDSTTLRTTVKQALNIPHWFKVMQEEYNALIQNNTWTLDILPNDIIPIRCKWVFRTKYNAGGSFQQYCSQKISSTI